MNTFPINTQQMVERFVEYYHEHFQRTSLYDNMKDVFENSPYHRERSVAVHTDMVVAQFLIAMALRGSQYTPGDVLVGALSCAFHDVGKPPCEQVKWSEERGEYRAYSGHEIVSARLWEDYVANVENIVLLRKHFGLTTEDIAGVYYEVAFTIEHHLPYSLKKVDKRLALAGSINPIFFEVLRADCWGRISDDHDVKKQNVEDWIAEFQPVVQQAKNITRDEVDGDDLTVYVLIGASGSGKSSFCEKEQGWVYSWDAIRLQKYLTDQDGGSPKELYNIAYQRTTADKSFNSVVMKEYNTLLKLRRYNKIFIDNINISNKRRKVFVDDAKREGYKVVAVLFANEMATLLDRVETRTDKHVPSDVVLNMWKNTQMPFGADYDGVVVVLPYHLGNYPVR